jgi:hypothetical protein
MPIISAEIFDYHLYLYEKEYGALTKWNKLLNFIDNRYSGDTMNTRVEQFLQEFYAVRERIITEIPQKEAFQRFNNKAAIGTVCRQFFGFNSGLLDFYHSEPSLLYENIAKND